MGKIIFIKELYPHEKKAIFSFSTGATCHINFNEIHARMRDGYLIDWGEFQIPDEFKPGIPGKALDAQTGMNAIPPEEKDPIKEAIERYHRREKLTDREKQIVYDDYEKSVSNPVSWGEFWESSYKKSIANDPVNHPSHYTSGKIEVADFIEDQKLDWHTGTAVKYIARAGKKDPAKEKEDLQKAVWYLNRKIEKLL